MDMNFKVKIEELPSEKLTNEIYTELENEKSLILINDSCLPNCFVIKCTNSESFVLFYENGDIETDFFTLKNIAFLIEDSEIVSFKTVTSTLIVEED
ncbi:MAG: hypothetical protein KQ78_01805 [Candidatus Izimaplasma bacterium HR2]|nr:MAG: hypothetical protein KQ78_01805 [Candidatus Izimaplasma bacterium HR2]